jgi:hypothetical protein
MDSLEKLFKKKIVWHEKEVGGIDFFAVVEGERCELRMNDFPDEPLYTLKYRGSTTDFDDAPDNWVIPKLQD